MERLSIIFGAIKTPEFKLRLGAWKYLRLSGYTPNEIGVLLCFYEKLAKAITLEGATVVFLSSREGMDSAQVSRPVYFRAVRKMIKHGVVKKSYATYDFKDFYHLKNTVGQTEDCVALPRGIWRLLRRCLYTPTDIGVLLFFLHKLCITNKKEQKDVALLTQEVMEHAQVNRKGYLNAIKKMKLDGMIKKSPNVWDLTSLLDNILDTRMRQLLAIENAAPLAEESRDD